LFDEHELLASTGARKSYEPDYHAFVIYAYAVLCRVKVTYPEAERVDFIVENKSNITKYIHDFYKTLPQSLRHIKREDLIPLLGKFISGSKDLIPLQAADFLCWHNQRAQTGKMEPDDIRRWNPMARKKGFSFDVPEDLLTKFAEAWARQAEKNGGSKRS
jgi:hypothetical protein